MKKEKYKIFSSYEWAMNEAYKEGYEFLAVIQENYGPYYNNNSSNDNINNAHTAINIYNPISNTVNKILMQLSPTAEVLYGNPRADQNENS